MTTLYFINPDAQWLTMTVELVDNGSALTYGAPYDVDDTLATELLVNTLDWADTAPAGLMSAPPGGEEQTAQTGA